MHSDSWTFQQGTGLEGIVGSQPALMSIKMHLTWLRVMTRDPTDVGYVKSILVKFIFNALPVNIICEETLQDCVPSYS